jgi:CHAT domain-containing protein
LVASGSVVRLPTRSIVKEWPLRVRPLPGSLTEGNLILGKIANARRGTLSSGAEASELNVKRLSRPAFLHVATHGFFLEDVERAAPEERMRASGFSALRGGQSPLGAEPTLKGPLQVHNPLLRSGLALAGFNRLADGAEIPSSENDGILTAMEVTGLDLTGTQLVVLSACETGLGETKRGEGVAGLRQAFRIAGARNVVMSLWNVPDQETVWLMDAFYSSYVAGKTPSAALKEARSAVRKRLVERDGVDYPRYWGAFILEGPPPPKNP